MVSMPAVFFVSPDGTEIEIPQSNIAFPNGDQSGNSLLVTEQGEPDVVYGIKVVNPNGKEYLLENAVTVTAPSLIDIVGIDPPFSCTCARSLVTITADGGLVSTPSVALRPAAEPDADPVDLDSVAFLDSGTITAVVPLGLLVGDYDVIVTNPPSDGATGTLEAGFRVVSEPVPNIVGLSPTRGDTQADTSVTIAGANFRDPVEVVLLDEAGQETAVTTATVADGNTINATLPSSSMAAGPYLIRVTNTDQDTYFTFGTFIVTNPSANVRPFEQQPPLNVGRRLLAATSAIDDLGSRYLYAIGGDDGDEANPMDTVEVASLSKFGVISGWRSQKHELTTARTGAAAVTVAIFDAGSPYIPTKSYVYVLGGLDASGNPLSSVERALVLPTGQAPQIESLERSDDTGDLAAGTWYYKVSAVLNAGDPDNPSGETLASDEAVITLATDGAVDLTWSAVTVNSLAAQHYRVYRSDAKNGVSQTEHLIADGVTGTTYTDAGDDPGTELPLGPGATGVFVADQSLTQARWGHAAVVVTDDTGARSILVLGGKAAASAGYLTHVEASAIDDGDGTIAAFSTSNLAALPESRAFHAALVQNSQTFSEYAGTGSVIYVAGGISGSGEVFRSNQDSIQYASYDASGLGTAIAWTAHGGKLTRAGTMSVFDKDKFYAAGGVTVASDTAFGAATADVLDAPYDVAAQLVATNVNDASENMLQARAFGGVVSAVGFFYFIGGTATGTDALTSAERSF
jgi:hypothetical protein